MFSAKRKGPPIVSPVTIGGIRYAALHWGKSRGLKQNGGYIAACDESTGKQLWTLKVYTVVYGSEFESDVQDLFIKSIAQSGAEGKLEFTDEKGNRYIVNPQTRSVETD